MKFLEISYLIIGLKLVMLRTLFCVGETTQVAVKDCKVLV